MGTDDHVVHEEKRYDDGRRFVWRYYGTDKEWVEKRVREVKALIDPYRSPTSGRAYRHGDFWAVDLQYYGLD